MCLEACLCVGGVMGVCVSLELTDCLMNATCIRLGIGLLDAESGEAGCSYFC